MRPDDHEDEGPSEHLVTEPFIAHVHERGDHVAEDERADQVGDVYDKGHYVGDCVTYVRVSTPQQVAAGISMPEQSRRIREFCRTQKLRIVEEYVEPGKSARTEKRREFQRMLTALRTSPPQAATVVVFAYNRFFRDEAEGTILMRELRRNGVRIRSVTQDSDDSPASRLANRLIQLLDEEKSRSDAEHTKVGLHGNARQNFWNGGRPPYAYESYTVEQRGSKLKKRLRVVETEAEVVHLIVKLALEGDGTTGPLGMKSTAVWLNQNGYRTRTNRPFTVNAVSRILHDETYTGTYWYGRKDSVTGEAIPREQWVPITVPAILPKAVYERLQVHIRSRQPAVTPPRIITSGLMLGGVARCGSCGRTLKLATGKSRTGKMHRYYVCAGKLTAGACEGGAPVRVPEGTLDKMVLDLLHDRVLTADFTERMVNGIFARRSEGQSDAVESIRRLRAENDAAVRRVRSLLKAVGSQLIDDDDDFKAEYKLAKEDREKIARMIASHEATIDSKLKSVTAEEAAVIANGLRVKIETADPHLRRRYVRALVSQVFVNADNVVVTGPSSAIAEIASGTPVAEVLPPPPPVRVFAQDWCG